MAQIKYAEGSSGQVFLCKNMLDQHEYVLKKIFIEEDDDEEKILEFGEVITVTILRNLLGNLIVRVMTLVGREILPAKADDVQVQQLKEENLQLKEKLRRVDMYMDVRETCFPKRPYSFWLYRVFWVVWLLLFIVFLGGNSINDL
ncbi:uncharacterized protein LOC112001772 isoform X3 [Quercus suber]|uniref:uncharacterized protein LOC112001772 isoform X3 n=1 Tax=Quercus suber TaxID=58331 RepID=UPI000D2667F6|nr:hypothetical protein CFP56_67152 [Quercus suber]